jgi:hypothetical protein
MVYVIFLLCCPQTNKFSSKFTVEEIRGLMEKPTNIRNMSVIAHGLF